MKLMSINVYSIFASLILKSKSLLCIFLCFVNVDGNNFVQLRKRVGTEI